MEDVQQGRAAFSLAANGLLFFWIGVEIAPYSGGAINLSWPLLHALPDNFYGSRVMSKPEANM